MISALENIYISPLESCNLNCRSCYTRKTQNVLSNKQILSFVTKYQKTLANPKNVFLRALNATHSPREKKSFKGLHLKSIVFCGGEVFLLPDFPKLVNQLLSKNIFITIITSGTIDRLSEISDPHNCQLIVSFDGPQNIHDHNRGTGNFDKSIEFVQHAISLNFPVHIFYLVTKNSYSYKDSFPQEFYSYFINHTSYIGFTYLTDRLGSLTLAQILDIKRHYRTYPSKNFGCFQLSLQSDGLIYGCCESSLPLASISDPIGKIIKNFQQSLSICRRCHAVNNFSAHNNIDDAVMFFSARNHVSEAPTREHGKKSLQVVNKCNGCCDPNFLCGYPRQLGCQNCCQVVKLFNQ